MKEIKATQEFSYKGKIYTKGDILKVTNIKDLVILNEHGFIEPLSAKDLQNFADTLKTKSKEKEE